MGQFAFNRYWISSLGDPNVNPEGKIYFNIGCFITGILIIPIFRYFYNIIGKNYPKTGKINLFIGIIISISLSLIGIFDDTYQPTHNILAGNVYVGFFLYAMIMTYIMIKQLIKKAEWPNTIGFVIIYTPIYIFMILVFAIPIANAYPVNKLIIWEWVTFLTLFFWLLGTFLLIKNKPHD